MWVEGGRGRAIGGEGWVVGRAFRMLVEVVGLEYGEHFGRSVIMWGDIVEMGWGFQRGAPGNRTVPGEALVGRLCARASPRSRVSHP